MSPPAETPSPRHLWRLTDPLIWPLVPDQARPVVQTLWSLDARLAELASAGREPALRQIRLRWWADQLGALDRASPPAEPLLRSVAADLPASENVAVMRLAEHWFDLVDGDAAAAAARGAELFGLTSRLMGHEAAGFVAGGALWGQVDRALAGDGTDDTAGWRHLADAARRHSLAGLPRGLAALAALAAGIARRHGRRAPRREQLLLLRVGLLGR